MRLLRPTTVALLALLALPMHATTAEANAPAAPTVQATVSRAGAVTLRWAGSGNAKQATRVVAIERRLAGESAFTPLVSRPRAPKRGSYVDKTVPETAPSAAYQVRLRESGTASPWTAVTVMFASEAPPSGRLPLEPGQRECDAGIEDDFLRALNAERAARGRAAVTVDSKLSNAARDRSIGLAAAGRLWTPAHAGLDATLRRHGWTTSAGEAATMTAGPAPFVLHGFMNSSSHYPTMINSGNRVGISCVIGNGWAWWTVLASSASMWQPV